MAIPARWAKEHCMHDGNGMGTSNSDPYPTTEAAGANNNISATPPRFCSSLKVDRLTGARLQGGFAECLGQRWL